MGPEGNAGLTLNLKRKEIKMNDAQFIDNLVNSPEDLAELADQIESIRDRLVEAEVEDEQLKEKDCPVCEAYRDSRVALFCEKHRDEK